MNGLETTSPLEVAEPPRSGSRVALTIISVVCVLAAAVWGFIRFFDTPAGGTSGPAADLNAGGPQWHTVKPKSFDITVSANGELDAKHKVTIANAVEGRTTITEIVPEGSRVVKDQVLVRLADDAITKQIDESKELVQKGQADKIASEQDLLIEKSEAESLRRAEEVKLALSELELAKWKEGTVVQKRRDLDLAIVEAVDNLRIAQRNAEEAKKLFEAKFISEGEYDDDQLTLKKAIAAEQKAREDKQIYEKYTYPQEEKKFNSDVEEARASLDRVIRKNTSKIARATATYEAAVRTAKAREERLAKLEQQLEFCTIRAPADGIVVYATSTGSSRYRRDPLAKNVEVSYNENLIILPDTTRMIAIVKVNESRIADIAYGQRATVEIPAMRGKPVEGTVFQKGNMAEESSRWLGGDVREYEVRIDLPPNIGSSSSTATTQADGERRGPRSSGGGGGQSRPPRGENSGDSNSAAGNNAMQINPGMRCSGVIFVDRVENALTVPVHAVFSKGRERFVYVRRNDGLVEAKVVRLGKSNESDVEVREGLKEGDAVLLRDPKPGEVHTPPKSKADKKTPDDDTPPA